MRIRITYVVILLMSIENTLYANLTETIEEYRESRIMLSEQTVDAALIDPWISRFENDVAKESDHPKYYLAENIIADLRRKKGDYEGAKLHYDLVYNSKDASVQDRLLAGFEILNLTSSPGKWLDFIDSYEDFINRQKQAGADVSQIENILVGFDYSKAQRHLDYAKNEAKKLNNVGQHEDAEKILYEHFNKANSLLTSYLEKISGSNSNLESFALYTQSEVTFALSEYYSRHSMKEEQNQFLTTATSQLEAILEKHPQSTISNSAAVLLFAIKDRFMAPNELLSYIGSKVKSVRPGHSLLNYISDYAGSLANSGKYEEALNFYDLLINKEQEWFPEEYMQHINYQLGVLRKAMVETNLGYLTEARQSYSEYSMLPVVDKAIKEYSIIVAKAMWEKFVEISGLNEEVAHAGLLDNDTNEDKVNEQHLNKIKETVVKCAKVEPIELKKLSGEAIIKNKNISMSEHQRILPLLIIITLTGSFFLLLYIIISKLKNNKGRF